MRNKFSADFIAIVTVDDIYIIYSGNFGINACDDIIGAVKVIFDLAELSAQDVILDSI